MTTRSIRCAYRCIGYLVVSASGTMREKKLPKEILKKVSLSSCGEYVWEKDDVLIVLKSSKKVGLACITGQPQFQIPIGIAETYWRN